MKFSEANTKLQKLYNVAALAAWLAFGRKVYSFDLLSGFTCPGAYDCKSKAVRTATGRRIQDSTNTLFRCFSASQEVNYTNVYNLRRRNYDSVRKLARGNTAAGALAVFRALQSALPDDAGIVRFHVAGDFFSRSYWLAVCMLARENPGVLFYCYTKSLRIVDFSEAPENLVLTASMGGRYDEEISTRNLRFSRVVFSVDEAQELGLEIDEDDSHAARPDLRNQSFGLLIHGTQPKGSAAGKALQALKKARV